jgi:hypothetical protein
VDRREQYIPPVGFAREPARERRRWISRIIIMFLVVLLAWLLIYRVIHAPSDSQNVPLQQQTALPGGG